MNANESPVQWRAWLALVAVLVVAALNVYWPWGVLVAAWAVHSALTGSIHFVEEIQRARAPFLFWAVTLTWAACGAYWIAIDFI